MSASPLGNLKYKTDTQRWQAVQARDPAADEYFVYAVETTGIYARPSSAARLPKRENVIFFDSSESAEAAGYRPSRHSAGDRSSADSYRVEIVTAACRFIETADPLPNLATLSNNAQMSSAYFHRIFKTVTGLTPKAYIAALMARRLREQLENEQQTVTDAIYGAGFSSNSRFYETSQARLGMSAKDYRRGGLGAMIHFAVGQCSMGAILVAQSQKGICAILMGDDPEKIVRDLQDQFPQANLIGADAEFEQLVAQVVGFVEQPNMGLNLPLDVQGTAFQERVWLALREVPPGTTVSYTDIAERIGSPKAVRAVAQACAANHIAVAIPCHRVVRRNGDLSGYRWGVERKQQLLHRELKGEKL
ncbi:bifunctional DNA-binding transcriptional regulator/O6-methylguanine-DNA methyltransferase Ada [Rouxiella badensis]|jgi:AraC family transcriptional regulator of adaptative response/methylated-DNA-[protein]-cysteine methyltransferase|uniref:bifunctional DNA-binding transcriptional regulator/O6-methylguanine-DNA methyltransferase Ada n=1 Tax=Rouxiella badensis TaxID=1646377 RepID=UPI00037A0855|nr:bifunctional DNA-binding transcriptional regulator/O6-methylguanine-DNA methyltransferase Ada [Rouxiella badensis]QII38228.1 bifunctional DNA-binding transcriptional regulator/O6-methylguanine-DNA methyltransferase Ada [Rouxiella badensis]